MKLTVVGVETPIWRKRLVSVVSHALLIGASILMLYPLLWMLSASLKLNRDYADSLAWATAKQVNDEDIAALTQIRQRYGFPPQS